MGKYMKKSKVAEDVAVMEMAQPSLGVRTRAKTLALQRLQQSAGGGSYLQLRSRKLEKLPLPTSGQESKRQRHSGSGQGNGVQNPSPNCKTRPSSRLRVSSKLVEENQQGEEPGMEKLKNGDEIVQIGNSGDGEGDENSEAFIGENSSNFGGRDRSTRETTPCSFIRDPGVVGTPGSTASSSSPVAIRKRTRSTAQRLMPTAKEVEEFFAGAEQQQHRQFIEKYNFDPVKEKPLSGRYGWVKADH
ncbi:unnamed protein product [Rhodiola kirilowii]